MPAQDLMPALVSEVEKALPHVFQVQFGLIAEKSPAALVQEDNDQEAVVAVVNLSDAGVTATIILYFPKQAFCPVVSQILGEPVESITKENVDAVGEILNMVYCGIRKPINESGYDFKPAVPTVMWGKGLGLSLSTFSSCDAIPFTTLNHRFQIRVGTNDQKAG